jgi:pantoate--beta-alanine ligase
MKKTSSIKLIRTIAEMRAFSEAAAKKKKKVGLIPTMGAFHEGHLSLVKAAKRFKKRCDLIVVSIFVNPVQFAPHEDLGQYPRDLEGDMEKLQKIGGVAAVFAPEAVEMFPSGYKTYVEVDDLSRRLCGRSRSGHFRGVATVVMKLFNIVQPQVAFFGMKDYQQTLIIKKMSRDLNLQVEVEQRPTVRDKEGIALSTRNTYLTEDQRQTALALRRALEVAEKLIVAGERNASIIVSNMREVIRSQSGIDVDYISICHPETLADLEAVEFKTLVALAVRIGRARLIDNLFVDLVALDKKEKLRKAKKAAEAKGPGKAVKKGKQRS